MGAATICSAHPLALVLIVSSLPESVWAITLAQKYLVENTTLGIPAMFQTEGLHGYIECVVSLGLCTSMERIADPLPYVPSLPATAPSSPRLWAWPAHSTRT
jgi:hypothetical protein